MLTREFFWINMNADVNKADIISDKWPESFYRNAG